MAEHTPKGENEDHPAPLDFARFPPIFVLPTHMDDHEFDTLIDKLEYHKAPHTYDMTEASLVLARITKKRRAEYELRCRKVWTEEVKRGDSQINGGAITSSQLLKRKEIENSTTEPGDAKAVVVIDDSSTESEVEAEARGQPEPYTKGKRETSHCIKLTPRDNGAKPISQPLSGSSTESEQEVEAKTEPLRKRKKPDSDSKESSPALPASQKESPAPFSVDDLSDTIKVVRAEWLDNSLRLQQFVPLNNYIVYEGKRIPRPAKAIPAAPPSQPRQAINAPPPMPGPSTRAHGTSISEANKAILERARADMEAKLAQQHNTRSSPRHHFKDKTFSSSSQLNHHVTGRSATHATRLQHQTTSEHDYGSSSELPEMPEWMKQHTKYACERSTLADPPNKAFIAELKKIKLARLLTADDIGVRAYSTSIASLAAYPYSITSPREILALPGCDVKIANLWVEYKNTGHVGAADDAENDEALSVLRLFYDIWGVGATTARGFYYDRGWRDLDDIVEYGWNTLNREQQIGVKYYEEFLDKIPRTEVEQIARTVHTHAVLVRDDRIQSLVVGGYRRGKDASGDVDIIISHPEQAQTLNIIYDVVASLETEGWITHTLQLKLTTSHRGQSTLPYRTGGGGHGFDSLDKALVVWQDPSWPDKSIDLAANAKAKNPNPHRRVDIIVSPWRTVGCAVMGWSGGTTFQRDLRRYAKYTKGWKFDSSGIRDRQTGQLVELKAEGEIPRSMEEAERKVFEGLGLVYREPWERCTG